LLDHKVIIDGIKPFVFLLLLDSLKNNIHFFILYDLQVIFMASTHGLDSKSSRRLLFNEITDITISFDGKIGYQPYRKTYFEIERQGL